MPELRYCVIQPLRIYDYKEISYFKSVTCQNLPMMR